MPTLTNLATRRKVPEPLEAASSLVARKNIRLTTAAMLITAVSPRVVIVVMVVTVIYLRYQTALIVAVTISFVNTLY